MRKKEERGEARERETERNDVSILMRERRESVIKKIFFFSFELQCTSKDRCAL